jgi:BirA family biotin operon repressor/biotin-[acetyl-CoA-carboxylase] ligase
MECLFEQVNTTPSTNQDLMTRWRNNELFQPTSRMAIHQTNGKGRRGNVWIAQQHQSLTFSLAYCFESKTDLKALQPLSLMVGLAVLEGIAQYWGVSIQVLKKLGFGLKWPNDIYLGDAKLGGILIELGHKNAQSPIWAIIGIGLNLHPINEPIDSAYPIASLDQVNLPNQQEIDITDLWQALSKHLLLILDQFCKENYFFDPLPWNELHRFAHQEVVIMEDSKILQSGKVIGVNSLGVLLLETPIGLQQVYSGNVSLRVHH